MSVAIRVFASVPSAIMMVLGFLLIFMGSGSNNSYLISVGISFVVGGILLQVLLILMRSGRRY